MEPRQDRRRLPLVAREPIVSGNHQHVERSGLSRIEERPQARTFGLVQGSAEPVVRVDVRISDGPALLRSVGAPVLDLPNDALGVLGLVAFIGALPGVDRGDHRRPPTRSTARSCASSHAPRASRSTSLMDHRSLRLIILTRSWRSRGISALMRTPPALARLCRRRYLAAGVTGLRRRLLIDRPS